MIINVAQVNHDKNMYAKVKFLAAYTERDLSQTKWQPSNSWGENNTCTALNVLGDKNTCQKNAKKPNNIDHLSTVY